MKHSFKSQDFKDMLYPIHTLKKGEYVLNAFDQLMDYEEFRLENPPIPLDPLMRYIIYAYDQKSPFVTQIEDLVERKKQAMLEAGVVPGKNGFNEKTKRVLNCEDGRSNKAIIRYCRLQGKDLTGLIASQEAFYQINLQLITNDPSDEDKLGTAEKKAKLDNLASQFNTRLDEKARSFLTQETANGLHKDLWSLADDEAMINLTPEDYAS